ncbi:alpha/beta fold hydrolase, partial [Cesiribacter andamanensis]|uniref:alpha/beta fold hydrolase n=1 Tax=Cesiribacter andamanensis TaxID=649507 RepID=UPI00058E1383
MIRQPLLILCLFTCLSLACQAQTSRQQPVLQEASFAYTETGRGPETLLLIHGLGGNRQHWQHTIPALS